MDNLAGVKAARVAVFDAWLRSVDEDLLGTGSFLADFGLKNINDLDVLSSVESEQIVSVFEKAHVPPFQRNRLKNALDARRNAAMALKRKVTGTPPQPPKNALTALDPDLVPKSSSGSAGRLSSPRVSESSADWPSMERVWWARRVRWAGHPSPRSKRPAPVAGRPLLMTTDLSSCTMPP